MKRLLICFIVYLLFFGSFVSAYTIVAPPDSLVVSAIVVGPPPGSSSSGGGGGGYLAPTNVTFTGTTSSLAKISLLKDGQLVLTALANLDSKFSISLNDNSLNGDYVFSVLAEDLAGNKSHLFNITLHIVSHTSTTVSGISLIPVLPAIDTTIKKVEKEGKEQNCIIPADLNGDCRVDLVDFSILKYWRGKSDFPKKIDLNKDGVLNIKDFSILAYYWTG